MSKLILVSMLTLMLLQQQQINAFKIVNFNVQKSFVPVSYAYVPAATTAAYSYVPPPTSAPAYSYVPPQTSAPVGVVSKTVLVQGVSDSISSKINLLSSILQTALQIKTQISQGLLRSYQNSITSGPQNYSYSKTVTIG